MLDDFIPSFFNQVQSLNRMGFPNIYLTIHDCDGTIEWLIECIYLNSLVRLFWSDKLSETGMPIDEWMLIIQFSVMNSIRMYCIWFLLFLQYGQCSPCWHDCLGFRETEIFLHWRFTFLSGFKVVISWEYDLREYVCKLFHGICIKRIEDDSCTVI